MTACSTQSVGSVRRYYLLERLAAKRRCEFPIADVFWAKQLAEPGTDLPSTFPSLSQLEEAGYSTIEDVTGSDIDELMCAGLSKSQAAAVVSAIAAL